MALLLAVAGHALVLAAVPRPHAAHHEAAGAGRHAGRGGQHAAVMQPVHLHTRPSRWTRGTRGTRLGDGIAGHGAVEDGGAAAVGHLDLGGDADRERGRDLQHVLHQVLVHLTRDTWSAVAAGHHNFTTLLYVKVAAVVGKLNFKLRLFSDVFTTVLTKRCTDHLSSAQPVTRYP